MDDGIGVMKMGVSDAVRADFPRLQLWVAWVAVPAGHRSTPTLRGHLAEVDDRVRGLPTGGLRMDKVASAYRGFARQIGLDPDADRNPLERLALERLQLGRMPTYGPLLDAMSVAMLETSVPMWTIKGDAASGWLRVDTDEQGVLVVADDKRTLAPLMATPEKALFPTLRRREMSTAIVYALQVGKVPSSTLEEAFWHVNACVADKTIAR